LYDIPAVVDYILEQTGHQRLTYVGHSMGCAVYFIAMSTHPRLNQKIDLMLALAPATTVANMKSPLKLFAPHVRSIQVLLQHLIWNFAYRIAFIERQHST
jgi:lysosomal acid lipase/cholesteryl ester hydrolase